MLVKDEEKSQGLLKSAANYVMSWVGGSKTKEDVNNIEVDSIEPVSGEREEMTEAQFAFLVEDCQEDEIVVR